MSRKSSKNSLNRLINRYVKSLYSLMINEFVGELDLNIEQMTCLSDLFQNKLEEAGVVESKLMFNELADLLLSLNKEKLTAALYNLIHVMKEDGVMFLLPNVLRKTLEKCLRFKGIDTAIVTFAHPPKKTDIENITAELREVFGREFLIEVKENSDLIAGSTVQIGSYLIDASLRKKINNLKNFAKGRVNAQYS